MGQELVLRIHTQAEFHAAGIIQLVHILEEEVAALCLFQQQRLYLIQLGVVVGRGIGKCDCPIGLSFRFCGV